MNCHSYIYINISRPSLYKSGSRLMIYRKQVKQNSDIFDDMSYLDIMGDLFIWFYNHIAK